MTKTPDVTPGQTITSAWGNEIRNRTTQVFATQAELTAWTAPDGSFAINLADRALWERIGSNWYRQKSIVAFGSATERDSAWPSPPTGAMCVTIDTFTVWLRVSGFWMSVAPVRKTWFVQEAVIGGSIGGTLTQIGGPLTIASAPQDRLALIQSQTVTNEANATQLVQINLRNNGGDLAVGKCHPGNTMWLQRFLLLPGGSSYTFTVHAQVVLGGGNVGFAADPNWNLLSVSVLN